MSNVDRTSDPVSYRVHFSAVGRGKKTWTVSLKEMPSEATLENLVRKSKALGSNDIECVFDDETLEYGTVIVGGFRPVGSFMVEDLW